MLLVASTETTHCRQINKHIWVQEDSGLGRSRRERLGEYWVSVGRNGRDGGVTMGRSEQEGREECTVSPAIVWGCTYFCSSYITHFPPVVPVFLSLSLPLTADLSIPLSVCLSLHLPPLSSLSIVYMYQVPHYTHDNNTSVRKLCASNSHSTLYRKVIAEERRGDTPLLPLPPLSPPPSIPLPTPTTPTLSPSSDHPAPNRDIHQRALEGTLLPPLHLLAQALLIVPSHHPQSRLAPLPTL
jgi:hypothetical protein